MNAARILGIAVALWLVNSAMAGWTTSGNNMYSDVPGNVGVGTSAPGRKFDVGGDIQLSGEIIANSGTKWFCISRGSYVDLWAQGYDVISFEPNRDLLAKPQWDNFKIERQGDKVGLRMTGSCTMDGGLYAGQDPKKHIEITRGGYADFAAYGYDVIEFQPNPALLAAPSWEHFRITRQGDKVGLYMTGSEFVMGKVGIGTTTPSKELTVCGNVVLQSKATGATILELGEGLDYAEGFDVVQKDEVAPGTVLVIDPDNTGKLTVSTTAYDTKVAGIVAGAKNLGSGVRLGTGQFDQNVALAGRVYCNVDATEIAVRAGDLLTTSTAPGYAMKVADHTRSQGAVLGKAMESLEQGKKGQILVLVALQ